MKREDKKIIDSLVDSVSLDEVSKRLSEKDLLEYVVKNFNNEDIKSKNGMLKFLRSEGLSCSMDRVFKMYVIVEKEFKKNEKVDEKIEVVS